MAETYEVKLDAQDLTHAVALFLSRVAVPGAGDAKKRDALYDSLCAWMIRQRAKDDPAWANQPQSIVPRLAVRGEAEITKDLKPFNLMIRDRLTAGHIAAAFLKAAETGGTPVLPPGAARLSLNEIAASVLGDLDMTDPSNILTRLWRPSRRVIHLCAAWVVSLSELDVAEREAPTLIGPIRDRVFLATVLARGELMVPLLAKINPPIPADDLIRIVAWPD